MNSVLDAKDGNEFRLVVHLSEELDTNGKLKWVLVPNSVFFASTRCKVHFVRFK